MRAAVAAPARLGLGLGLTLALALGGCGGDDDDGGDVDAGVDECPIAAGTGVSFDATAEECDKLSSYRFFVGPLADMAPNDRVVPYDLNSPLFSDYTAKDRFLWLPEGTSMDYHPEDTFDVPVGSVFIKTFSYPDDVRSPDGSRQLLETRLLYRTAEQWEVATYVWDETQTEAYRQVAGARIASEWIHFDGQTRTLDYSVPDKNQCKNCHEEHDDLTAPIGPKARHLNRMHDYPGGAQNQLSYLAEQGLLSGLPADIAQVPLAPVWDDPNTGTVEERARTWMDINCAHCHNPTGAARTSGLDLSHDQSNPYEFGVCKGPVAAGGGSGGRLYNIVPGQPDESILVYRLESTELDERMPEIGRQQVHEESTALIREWIAAMPGDCSAP